MKKLISLVVLICLICGVNAAQTSVLRYTPVYDTVLDMVNKAGTSSLQVEALGYSSPGDGGGGKFVLTNAITSTNFGSRIYSSRLNKSWERVIVNNTLTLRQFGGDPTATTDSRDNLQALLNACRSKGYTAKIDGDFRIVSTKPIIIGKVSRIEGPGKLWNSLPDGYVWSGNYSTAETYTDTSVLDENGNWVSWSWTSTAGIPPYAPWNGKTEMFHNATDCVIEGVKVDGGWGTTTAADGKPAGVIAITGIAPPTNPIEEYGYYQMFYNSQNVRFSKCDFTNIPGDCIEVGNRVSVVDCTFTEYGDHVVYMGHTGHTINVIGSRILNGRAATGTPGAADYVWQTQREPLKFRGTDNIVIVGNSLTNTSKQINAFITLQTASTQVSDLDGFVVANNRVTAGGFIYFAVDRPDGSTLLTIRNGKVTGNIVDLSSYFMHTSAGSALADIDISNNSGTCNIFAALLGHPYVTNAINNLSFNDNKIKFVNAVAAGAYLAGNIGKISFKRNSFEALTPTSPSSHVIVSGYVAANFPMGVNNQWHQISEVVLEDNVARNFYSWWVDAGFDAYDNAKTYAYGTHVMSEGTYEDFSVVSSGGVLYRNIAATTGNAPPNASYWAVYTPPTTMVRANRNTRYSSSPERSPNNAKYLFFRGGTANKQTLAVSEWANVNITTTTDPVSYDIGNQASRVAQNLSGSANTIQGVGNFTAVTNTAVGADKLVGTDHNSAETGVTPSGNLLMYNSTLDAFGFDRGGGLLVDGTASAQITGAGTLSLGSNDMSFFATMKLRDYTPTSDAVLFSSHTSGNNRFSVTLRTTGAFRLTFVDGSGSSTTYDMTPDVALVNGETYNVTITMKRTGNATLYINGLTDRDHNGTGVTVSISATQNIDVGSGNGTVWNALNTVQGSVYNMRLYSRELSISDVQSAIKEAIVNYNDQWGAFGAFYTSDFSAGANSWVGTDGANQTVAGNVDSINSQNDWLQVTRNTSVGSLGLVRTLSFTRGKYYLVRFSLFNPSGSALSNFAIDVAGAGGATPSVATVAANSQGELSFVYRSDIIDGSFAVRVFASDSAGALSSSVAVGQTFYIKGVTVTQVGAVMDLDFKYAAPSLNTKIRDNSGARDGTMSSGLSQIRQIKQLNPATISVGGGTTITKILSTTSTLDFPSIAANSSSTLTVALTGAAANDIALVGPPTTATANIVFTAYVSASGTVTVTAFNPTTGAIDPASATYRVSVISY